ncbi:polysaccharide biosynthesis tyrosine autokinase [Gordonia sp. VNK1]|uniref:polysaccharide biosynthesis tyrosine autokinase n=1 Tax=Gordonia oleivorans TaxID=3156618 RepID=UPI0032B32198
MEYVDTIDSSAFSTIRLLGALFRGWYLLVVGGLMGAVVALGFCLSATPMYQADSTLYVTSGVDADALSAYQGSLASEQRVSSYAQLATSEAILAEALKRDPSIDLTVSEASAAIVADATPDTVLLTISGVTSSPERSVALVRAVSDSIVDYVVGLERPSGGGNSLAKLTVVSPAQALSDPVSPKTLRNVTLGFVCGIIIGALSVLLRARFDTTVRTEMDVSEVVGNQIIGLIPASDEISRGRLVNFGSGSTPVAEAFRQVRTNLSFANVDDPVRCFIVTSSLPNEGKTTVSVNLAIALAEAGSRVLLVDADLRRGGASTALAVNDKVGFTNLVLGQGSASEIAQRSGIDGLDCLASGISVPNPAEVLGSDKACGVMASLREKYEYIVVDTPPLLPVADALVAAQFVDGVVLVTRSGHTRRPDIRKSLGLLEAGNVAVFGCILNDLDIGRVPGGYEYYTTTGSGTEPKS